MSEVDIPYDSAAYGNTYYPNGHTNDESIGLMILAMFVLLAALLAIIFLSYAKKLSRKKKRS